MAGDIFANRREMVEYDKRHVFSPTEGMRAFAYADGKQVDVPEGTAVSAGQYSKDLVIFKKAPKEFTLFEILKEVEITMPCRKFGLSEGVKVKIVPGTSPRSVTLLLMQLGEVRTEGNEKITYISIDNLVGFLQESFDEAVEKTGGMPTEEDYFSKLTEKVNRSGEFLNYAMEVVSIRKNE